MRLALRHLTALAATALSLLFAYRAASSGAPAASSSAGARPEKPGEAPLPEVSAVRWPEEASRPPSIEEWKGAEELSARGGGAASCRVRRVREWIRVRCLEGQTRELEQIAGPQVHTRGIEVPPGAYADVGSGGTVFAVRRGDRRVLQWLVPRYTSVVESESGVVLTEQWLPDEPGPTITIDPVEQHRGPVTGY